MTIKEIADNDELLEIGRLAIEDALIEMRDSRMFTIRNNGFVIKEKNGEESSIIRFGPEHGLRVGLLAIAEHLEKNAQTATTS